MKDSWNGLFYQAIDIEWVNSLEQNHICVEQLETFNRSYHDAL